MSNFDPQTTTTPEIFHKQTKTSPRKSWRSFLIGRPLSSADAPNETIGKLVGLANQTAFMLRLGLLLRPGVVIIEVPYQVE